MLDIFTIRILLVITFILIFVTVLGVIYLIMWIKRRKSSGKNRRVSSRVIKSYEDEPEVFPHCVEPPCDSSFVHDNSDYLGGSVPSGRHYSVRRAQPMQKLHSEYRMTSRAHHSHPDVICGEIFHAAEANVTHFLYDYAYAHQQFPPFESIYFKNNDQKYQLPSENRNQCISQQQHAYLEDHNNSAPKQMNHTFQIVSLVHEAPPDLSPTQSNTPLARLSPNSETSQLALRVLTLQDISRNEFRSTQFETTTTSSGDVSKGVQRSSNSEASWNKPIPVNDWNSVPDLVSKLTASNLAVSQPALMKNLSLGMETTCTSKADKCDINLATNLNIHSASSSESGDDSFTCSEFDAGESGKVSEALRGSFLTLMDEEIPLTSSLLSTDAVLDLDHVLSWGPNFESLAGVYEDIGGLPDTEANRTISKSEGKSKKVEVYV